VGSRGHDYERVHQRDQPKNLAFPHADPYATARGPFACSKDKDTAWERLLRFRYDHCHEKLVNELRVVVGQQVQHRRGYAFSWRHTRRDDDDPQQLPQSPADRIFISHRGSLCRPLRPPSKSSISSLTLQPEDGRVRHDLAVRSGVDWNGRSPPTAADFRMIQVDRCRPLADICTRFPHRLTL